MRKLLIGCGVLATLAVVAVILAGVMISSWVKKKFPEAGKIQQVQAEMVQRFGTPASFVPPLDGVPAAGRIESFLALRDSLMARRAGTAAQLGSLIRTARRDRPADRGIAVKLTDAIGLAQGGASLVTGVLDYVSARTRLLLAAGMGEGEYSYLFALTTFSWLQWDPLARPGNSTGLRDLGLGDDFEAAQHVLQVAFERQLENQLRALEAKTSRAPSEEAMLGALRTELDATGKTGKFPFAGTLPVHVAAALEPYRERLEATLPQTPGEMVLDVMQVRGDKHGFNVEFGGERGKTPQ